MITFPRFIPCFTCFGLSVPHIPLLRFEQRKVQEHWNSSHDVLGTEVVLFPWESLRTCPPVSLCKKTARSVARNRGPFVSMLAGEATGHRKKDIALCLRLVPVSRVPWADVSAYAQYSILGIDTERPHERHKRYVYVTNSP
jgi:hypothetical protein